MKFLSDAAVRQYREAGYYAPLRALPTATLVRGVDRYGNFEPEQRPDADCSPAALAYHAAVTGAHAQILMRDTGREMRA